jgi:transcriptional regulator with XRE-family HTH domain
MGTFKPQKGKTKMMKKVRWEDANYQKIKEAKVSKDRIVVTFANGDVVELSKENLVPFSMQEIDWNKLSFNPFEIIIPAKPHEIEIPWDKVRVLSDKEFSMHLAERAEEQAELIGTKLKRLREKKGMRSGELAERAGVTPQTVSRIEQGHTDVGFGTLKKMLAAMGYSLKDLAHQESESELENPVKNFSFLLKRFAKIGLDGDLLTNKIIPKRVQMALHDPKNNQSELLLNEAARYVGNIFGWSLDDIWGNSDLLIESQPFISGYFKTPSNANVNQIKAYSHYAYYLSKVLIKTQSKAIGKEYPSDIDEFRASFLEQYKIANLASLLEYIWDLGICVLPLNDPGLFHGASWNINGRHVIVLKQNTLYHSRWIFDLLHELYHVFAHLDQLNTSVIEIEELTPFSNSESVEELEANAFANRFLFGDRAEELAEKCVETAQYKLENLKKAVATVAHKEKIGEDILSNYLAFRLSHQGENWWSTASTFQITAPPPFDIAVDILKANIRMEKLQPIDYNLLNTAITN